LSRLLDVELLESVTLGGEQCWFMFAP
jgi:hypothetical protein